MEKVKIGIVGLGRLGKRHAFNLANLVPKANLQAVCSLNEAELEWAKKELETPQLFLSFEDMLAHADIDAVWIASSSVFHASQAKTALEHGFHVFVEKPMGVTLQECAEIEHAVQNHQDQVFLVGFVRRFDPSYRYAKELVATGAIGTPFLVRSQTCDLDEYAEFQLEFVKTGGGIFLDMNVHDIDLARWFIGSEIKEIYAKGASYVHPEFAKLGDADNTVCLATFENGAMAILSASRTAFHGHDTHTEIVGSKGILKIGMTPRRNRVEVFDSMGVHSDCIRDFYERFEEGFIAEAREFIECIIEGRKPEIKARDGTAATRIGMAMTESFKKGKVVYM
ncbi:MAG TPA: Gfo/Idh/MocA family oxidoreductase [Rectinema sp.]|jgi:myo-inositol 2-dehydrogenase/D-chiro-inositol 1-dehydrogenase|nr:inositol 2-dehydrogenase [Spirochaetaceae bacterium]HNV19271.1 Gfo/Idh/MocA family oxidoreductase [Rectinema sp.]HNZ93984.1 Gfo/Idh/MocA family oxidoreductase [Rectinema sp.]HOD58763.1 Gfo/Idh/MocA family oxidoreductase [Rectinema sp.]HOH17467.1 Gfo/Idh/MocA family oxidoreductase [Rectinema sp.]